jgi:hypothetical protein
MLQGIRKRQWKKLRSLPNHSECVTHHILPMRISSPVSGIVFIGGWFCEIAKGFSQGAGYSFQVGEVKSSLAQFVVGQGCLRAT